MTPVSQLLLAAALYLVGGWPYVIWGVFVRLVYVYHITWFVNSAAHTWGYRNFETEDGSRNLWWVGLTAYGEGWHNNHHAYPRSARHGLKPWEFDITYLTIRLMQKLRLAWDVRLPEQGASREWR
jgi:stearoyl-CoA desaturase (delta-9 desaturase)